MKDENKYVTAVEFMDDVYKRQSDKMFGSAFNGKRTDDEALKESINEALNDWEQKYFAQEQL